METSYCATYRTLQVNEVSRLTEDKRKYRVFQPTNELVFLCPTLLKLTLHATIVCNNANMQLRSIIQATLEYTRDSGAKF